MHFESRIIVGLCIEKIIHFGIVLNNYISCAGVDWQVGGLLKETREKKLFYSLWILISRCPLSFFVFFSSNKYLLSKKWGGWWVSPLTFRFQSGVWQNHPSPRRLRTDRARPSWVVKIVKKRQYTLSWTNSFVSGIVFHQTLINRLKLL